MMKEIVYFFAVTTLAGSIAGFSEGRNILKNMREELLAANSSPETLTFFERFVPAGLFLTTCIGAGAGAVTHVLIPALRIYTYMLSKTGSPVETTQ